MAKPNPETAPPKPAAAGSRIYWICAAAWLVPGLGHLMLGRRIRSAVLFACIVAMFALGVLMKGQIFATGGPSYLETLGYYGELCVGLALPVVRFFGYNGGDPFFGSSDYGTAYLVAAGMLNVLAVLDAYDIGVGRKA